MQINLPQIISQERDSWILWIPIIFGCGILFYFLFPGKSYLYPVSLAIVAIFTSFKTRMELGSLVANAVLIFLCGFLWSQFYDHNFIKSPKIEGKIYATAIGKIDEIREYENGKKRIILSDLELYSTKFDKKQSKSKKKLKKEVKLSTKPMKISKNTKKTYLNIENYTEIDRKLEFLGKKSGYSGFFEEKYQNPPHKISLLIRNKTENIAIGDVIESRVLLQPNHKGEKIDSYNFEKHQYFKKIGGSGFVISKIDIISKAPNTKNKIDIWRYKTAHHILGSFENKDIGAVLNALLLGIRDFINPELMDNIRKSGLAHLLSISGLHLSLAGLMFFSLFRFILTRSEFLTLRFNIKKIAAILAILSSFIYLIIAGSPIPAIRAFVMILVIFLAILFDKNANPLRSLALAALLILIISPHAIFSISFQMSFMAILALITFYNFFKKKHEERWLITKIFYYFLAIISSSLIAQIALTPLTIYYFNNFALFGILANLIAVPITALVIMPLAFCYLFLSLFSFEFITFYPLNISLEVIINTANYVTALPHSNISIAMISSASLALMISGFLWLSLWQQKWRFFGLVIILIGILLAITTPKPSLIIDGKRQFVAIYDDEKGLIFSKKPRKSLRVRNLMGKLNSQEFKTFNDIEDGKIFCEYEYCQANFKNQNILILTRRNKVPWLCNQQYDILINISKYQLPKCVDRSKRIIDNRDLALKGSQYLYFN